MYYKEGCLYPQCTPRSMCVFKAIIYRKKTVDCFTVTYEQKKLSVAICVCCIMSCSNVFLFQDGVFQRPAGCTPKKFLFVNHGGDLW